MKQKVNNYVWLGVFVVCLATISAALYVILFLLFDGTYLDVTKDRRYGLNNETQRCLDENQVAVGMRLYVSKDMKSKDVMLAEYAEYVRKLLTQYQLSGHDLIKLSVIEVEAFTSTQTEAETAGIEEIKRPSDEKYLYLGVVLTNAYGVTKTLPQLLPEGRSYLEDDITRALSVLQQDKLPRVGVLTTMFQVIETDNPMEFSSDADFVRFLRQGGYDLFYIRSGQPYIPENTDAVVVFYPVRLPRTALFALNQYLLRGGRVIVLLDVFSATRFAEDREYEDYESGMTELLQSVGLMYYENLLAGDQVNSAMMTFPEARIHYPFWLTLSAEQMATHRIMINMQRISLNHSGMFVETPQKTMHYTNLLSTGTDSGVMLSDVIQNLSYDTLLKNFQNMGIALPLAVLVEGEFPSLFEEPLILNPEALVKTPPFLIQAVEPGKLLAVGDSDWVFENEGRAYWLRNMLDYMTEASYVSVGLRKNVDARVNLSAVLFAMAGKDLAEQRQSAAAVWLKIKQNLVYYHENVIDGEASTKEAKQYENLLRQEIEQRQIVDKLDYLINEAYKRLKIRFGVAFILGSCLLSWGILIGLAWANQYRMRRKTGDIYHD